MADDRKVVIAADHAGFELKEELEAHLIDLGFEPIDLGTDSEESVDYPDFGARLARAVGDGQAQRGVLVCGAGIGMAMVANRQPGVRAANCLDERMATLSREHNDANVLCLGSRLLTPAQAKKILWTFLETPFGGGRHARRVAKIDQGSE